MQSGEQAPPATPEGGEVGLNLLYVFDDFLGTDEKGTGTNHR